MKQRDKTPQTRTTDLIYSVLDITQQHKAHEIYFIFVLIDVFLMFRRPFNVLQDKGAVHTIKNGKYGEYHENLMNLTTVRWVTISRALVSSGLIGSIEVS